MEMPAKQTPAASGEMVKLIRKLRWVGLEEKAERLEKELEQQPATHYKSAPLSSRCRPFSAAPAAWQCWRRSAALT
jgi:hypothetical protein